MLNIQTALKNESLDSIVARLHLICERVDGLIILNYDQIETPKQDEIAKECRGLILYEDNYDVATMAFKRFFNHGEFENNIDWETSYATEKVDGSLIQLFYARNLNRWCVSTRGKIHATGDLPNPTVDFKTFSDLIWAILGETIWRQSFRRDHCYTFS